MHATVRGVSRTESSTRMSFETMTRVFPLPGQAVSMRCSSHPAAAFCSRVSIIVGQPHHRIVNIFRHHRLLISMPGRNLREARFAEALLGIHDAVWHGMKHSLF